MILCMIPKYSTQCDERKCILLKIFLMMHAQTNHPKQTIIFEQDSKHYFSAFIIVCTILLSHIYMYRQIK